MPHATFVMKKHPASQAGGAQKQAYLQAQSLRNSGWSVSFVSEAEPAPDRPPIGRTLTLPPRRRYHEFLNAWHLVRAVCALRPDLVYQRVSGPYTFLAYASARLCDAVFVFAVASMHDCTSDTFRSKGQSPNRGVLARRGVHAIRTLLDWSIRFALQRAELVLCQTSGQKPLLRSVHGAVDAAVIPSVVPRVPVLEHPERSELQPRVLWVGKASSNKRPALFTQLACSLADLAEFRMVGVERTDLKVEASGGTYRHGLPDGLRILGELDREALRSEYASANLLVCTSRSEGFPNVFLEAWAAGCPVLSLWRDPDGILEREGVGWYAYDLADARSKIETALGDPELRREMGRRARRLVEKKFRPEIIDAKINPLFLRLVQQ